MTIIVKNKQTLIFDEFIFKCCVGKNGFTNNKIEGDKKTPSGTFSLDKLYFRKDRLERPETELKCVEIERNMAWCDDVNNNVFYNKEIRINKNIKSEKLFRKDYKYDLFIPIKYNWTKPTIPKGSAIFIHLTKNYTPTAGCVGLRKSDFLILAKLVKKHTKIKIL